MTDLIACISSNKGANAHVEKLIAGENWEKVYLVASVENKEHLISHEKVETILVDNKKMLSDIILDLKKSLKDKVKMMDTAVNIISGDGKEHMALLSALLQLGVGIRLVAFTKEGVKEI